MNSFLALEGGSQYSDCLLDPKSSVDEILVQSKLDFEYILSPVRWEQEGIQESERFSMVSRSDTKEGLSPVGQDFKCVQPREIVSFYKELCSHGDFKLDAIGQVDNGAKIWALAKTEISARIMGQDLIDSYLFFVTGNDGSMATRVKFLSKRIICNNMLNAAINTDGVGGWSLSYRHSREVPFGHLLEKMKTLPEYWKKFVSNIDRMANTSLSDDQAYRFFYERYAKASDKDSVNQRRVDKVMNIYKNNPTQDLRSTRDTVWGAVNAITYLNDHVRGRSPETRFKSAMMGAGETDKAAAWSHALSIVA